MLSLWKINLKVYWNVSMQYSNVACNFQFFLLHEFLYSFVQQLYFCSFLQFLTFHTFLLAKVEDRNGIKYSNNIPIKCSCLVSAMLCYVMHAVVIVVIFERKIGKQKKVTFQWVLNIGFTWCERNPSKHNATWFST